MPKTLKFFENLTVWIGSLSSIFVHSTIFVAIFLLGLFHVASWDTLLLVLTTVVSLEAIYLSIFIQMSVNQNTESLKEVEVDVDEIQRDVDEIQQDVDEIQEDEEAEESRDQRQHVMLQQIAKQVETLLKDIENLKRS